MEEKSSHYYDAEPAQESDYQEEERRPERLGNNRKHAHKKESRAKRRAAKISQRKNRK